MADTETADVTARTVPDSPRPRTRSRRRMTPGGLLAALSVVPALLVMSWVLAAVPLTAIHEFRAWLVIPAAVIIAAVLVPLALPLVRRAAVSIDTPWWPVIAVVVIAAGFMVFAAVTHDQQIILRRDAGSYAQIGYWLAHHPTLNAPIPNAAFEPAGTKNHLNLLYESAAFYSHGGHLVPQFMTGWPTLLAAAYWVGGWNGMFLAPAVLGLGFILALAGLAARVIGPRWAPLVALLAACAWPVLRVVQTTYSEPLAFLIMVGGLCLITDLVVVSIHKDGPGRLVLLRWGAFVTGLALTAGELVRVDYDVDFALIVPVIGWLWATRRPGVLPFVGGAIIGLVLGFADCLFVTRPYIKINLASFELMVAFLTLMTGGTFLVALIARTRGATIRDAAWWRLTARVLPALGAVAVAVLSLGLVVRPYVMTDHSVTDSGVQSVIRSTQINLGLPVDGSRGYGEQSLRWVSWYVGWFLLLAAAVGLGILVYRVLSGRQRRWLPALLVYAGGTALVLLRPGITPDHPWADRRLVTEVLPGVIMFASFATASLIRALQPTRATRPDGVLEPAARSRPRFVPAVTLVVAVVLLLVPTVVASAPVAARRTEIGEVYATQRVCAALRPTDSVLLLDGLWQPNIRSQCGLPVAQLLVASPASILAAEASIRRTGHTPVIAATYQNELTAQGLTPTRVILMDSRQDDMTLVTRPSKTVLWEIEFWIVRP